MAAYKSLANVERAFRSMKTVDLHVRPVFHYNTERVRAHVLLCMLAYYVEWHMRECLKPMLFDDEFIEQTQAARASPVNKALRSDHARAEPRLFPVAHQRISKMSRRIMGLVCGSLQSSD